MLFNHVKKMEDCSTLFYLLAVVGVFFFSFHRKYINLLNKRTNLVLARHFSMLQHNLLRDVFYIKKLRSLIFPSQLGKIYFILCTIRIILSSLRAFPLIGMYKQPAFYTLSYVLCFLFFSNLINYTAFILCRK